MEDFKKFTLLDESQRSKIATDSTKMESTKEDKPDQFHKDTIQERDARIAELEAVNAQLRHQVIQDLKEYDSLKSELDKAVTYLSKTYRYLNADSVLREEIKDFLKDKR